MSSAKSKEIWKKLLKEGKLTYIGFCCGDDSYFEENKDRTMVEMLLSSKLFLGRMLRKVKITIELLDK